MDRMVPLAIPVREAADCPLAASQRALDIGQKMKPDIRSSFSFLGEGFSVDEFELKIRRFCIEMTK